jgi:hypothetical protein
MTQRYSSKKGRSFGFFLIISCLILIGSAYILPLLTSEKYTFKVFIIGSLFVIPVISLLLWCWYSTYYMIDNETLIARCGPFIWRISIQEITVIRLNQKTIGGTYKPSLSWESIEIQYKMFRSIYITPEKLDNFLSELKKINDKIEIKQK